MLPEGSIDLETPNPLLQVDTPSPDGSLWDLIPMETFPSLDDPEAETGDAPPPSRLASVALKIAPAVVALRTWDINGRELASASGFFLNKSGSLMTDLSLLQVPKDASIDYITGSTGDGRHFRVPMVTAWDTGSGIAILQGQIADTPMIPLLPGYRGNKAAPVTVLALHPVRGLILADATLRPESAVATGIDWFQISGTDSPGAVGSPVLDEEGRAIGIVSLRLALKQWMNFAQALPDAATLSTATKTKAISVRGFSSAPPGTVTEDPQFLDAFSRLSEGRVESGARLLLKLSRKYPRSPEVWSLLGLAAQRLGATRDALSCHQRASALAPDNALYWRQFGMQALRDPKLAPAAMEALEKATAARPADSVGWLLYGETALRQKQYDKAISAFTQVTRLAPAYGRGYRLLGYSLQRSKNFTGAETAYRQSLANSPRDPLTWLLLGSLQQRKNPHAEAIVSFTRSTDLAPEQPLPWLHLAHAQRRRGDTGSAANTFKRYQQADAALAEKVAP